MDIVAKCLILIAAITRGKANYTCFVCTSSEAKNIRSVYDDHISKGDFWYRNGSTLAPCDTSAIFTSFTKCSVCLDNSVRPETVLVVLWNLTGSEKLVLESDQGSISFNKINCPRPERISTTEPHITVTHITKPNNDRGSRSHIILLFCFIFFFFVCLVLMILCKCKSQKDTRPAAA